MRQFPPSENPLDIAKPLRIQLRRTKGFRLPANTVVVSRPSKFGNPFKSRDGYSASLAVNDFKAWLRGDLKINGLIPPTLDDIRRELAGKNLACWCKLGDACHGSVLLEIANGKGAAKS